MGDRPPLTRDRIVGAAVALADQDGLRRLSMRRLAATLEYEVMSLYNHVEHKRDLLDAMLDAVVGEMAPPGSGPWQPALRAALVSQHDALLAHPWACGLWATTARPGPHRKRWMEAILRCLREGGFSRRMAHHGLHTVEVFVVGHTQQEVDFDEPVGDERDELLARFIGETSREDFPYLREHVDHHVEAEPEDDFGFTLDLVLDGLARHHDDP